MTFHPSLLLGLAMAMISPAMAQSTPAPSHVVADQPSSKTGIDVPAAAQAAAAIVDAFGKSISAGDLKTVETLLDPGVIILESGNVERSRAEYLGHHAKEDAEFLAGAHVTLMRRTARVSVDSAWVATENEIIAKHDGIPMTLISTETMVLKKTGPDWRIVHIHWSSKPKGE